MKYPQSYLLLFTAAFCASCGRNQTGLSKDKIKPETKAIDSSWGPYVMVRDIKKGRNGTILIASNKGAFRYDARQNDEAGRARLNDEVGQGATITVF